MLVMDRVVVLCGYNSRWRTYRKLMHPVMHKGAIEMHQAEQHNAAHAFMEMLFKSPKDLHKNAKLLVFPCSFAWITYIIIHTAFSAAGKFIISTTYGIHVDTPQNKVRTLPSFFLPSALQFNLVSRLSQRCHRACVTLCESRSRIREYIPCLYVLLPAPSHPNHTKNSALFRSEIRSLLVSWCSFQEGSKKTQGPP